MGGFSAIPKAFSTWPNASEWLICLAVMAVSSALIAIIARSGGLLVFASKSGGHIRRLITALIVPSLGEEIVFRVVLWPEGHSDGLLMALSLLLFVLWHVVEGTTFLKSHKAVLLNPYFLTCAAILGAACSIMVIITGSIWPAIIIHAVLVYIWQSFFGGLELLSPKGA